MQLTNPHRPAHKQYVASPCQYRKFGSKLAISYLVSDLLAVEHLSASTCQEPACERTARIVMEIRDH